MGAPVHWTRPVGRGRAMSEPGVLRDPMAFGRSVAGPSRPAATTPRVKAPAPIKRKHLGLRSPRGLPPGTDPQLGGFDTTPRAATNGVVPVPPAEPRDAETMTASARGFRPLVREGVNPSKHRAPVPDDLYATLAQEVRAPTVFVHCKCSPKLTQLPFFCLRRSCRRSLRGKPTGESWRRRTASARWFGRR